MSFPPSRNSRFWTRGESARVNLLFNSVSSCGIYELNVCRQWLCPVTRIHSGCTNHVSPFPTVFPFQICTFSLASRGRVQEKKKFNDGLRCEKKVAWTFQNLSKTTSNNMSVTALGGCDFIIRPEKPTPRLQLRLRGRDEMDSLKKLVTPESTQLIRRSIYFFN